MKRVQNNSLQAFTVYFSSETGAQEVIIKPGQSKVVPENYITEQVRNLVKRRLFKVTNA